MWNNAEHLVAYLAVPSMGAVLHTLNLRLFPEQLIYIVNHAEDRVIIVDSTLIPLLAGVLPHLTTLRHIVVVGGGDLAPLDRAADGRIARAPLGGAAGRTVRTSSTGPSVDERDAAALCYTSGTTGNPKGVAYSHRSIYLHSMQVCSAEAFGLGPAQQGARRGADVPRDGLGPAVRGLHVRRLAADAGPVPAGGAAGRDDRDGAADAGRRGADDLDRPAGLPRRQPDRHLVDDARSSSAARPARRR